MSEILNSPASDDFEWVNAWAGADKPAAKPEPKFEPKPTPARREEPVVAKTADADARARDSAAPRTAEAVAPNAPASAQAASQGTNQATPRDPATRPARKAAGDPELLVHPATRRFFSALRAPIPVQRDATPPAPTETVDGSSGKPAIEPKVEPKVTVEPKTTAEPKTTVEPTQATVPQPAPTREPAPAAMPKPASKPASATTLPADTVKAREPVALASSEPTLVREVDLLDRDIADIELARDALLEPAPLATAAPRKVLRERLAALRNPDSVPILVGSVVGVTLLIVFGAAASLISLR